MAEREVLVTRNGPVCRITLHRPERKNALNEGIRVGLAAVFTELSDDTATSVVVITGSGDCFSVGADLKEPVPTAKTWAERRHLGGRWQRLLDQLEALPQASVAVLHGHVVGGAALLATACDLRIAADDIRLSIPEVRMGIPLTWGGLPRLVREIGLPRTRDIVMTGRVVTADEALACGLAQRVVPRADLDRAVDDLVAELAAMPAAPLAMTVAGLRALGRVNGTAWADADLLSWSLGEPEFFEAAARYRDERLGGAKRNPD